MQRTKLRNRSVVHSLMRLLDHVPRLGLGLTLTLMRLLDHVPRLGLGLTLTLMWLLDHVPRFLRVHILSCLISHVAELSQKTVVNTRYVRVFSRYNSHAYKSQIFRVRVRVNPNPDITAKLTSRKYSTMLCVWHGVFHTNLSPSLCYKCLIGSVTANSSIVNAGGAERNL